MVIVIYGTDRSRIGGGVREIVARYDDDSKRAEAEHYLNELRIGSSESYGIDYNYQGDKQEGAVVGSVPSDVNKPIQLSPPSIQIVKDIQTGQNVPYGESSQAQFEKNLALARQEGKINEANAEDLRKNFYLLPEQGSKATAGDIIRQFRATPPEYQDFRNLGYSAQQSVNQSIIEDNLRKQQDITSQITQRESDNYFARTSGAMYGFPSQQETQTIEQPNGKLKLQIGYNPNEYAQILKQRGRLESISYVPKNQMPLIKGEYPVGWTPFVIPSKVLIDSSLPDISRQQASITGQPYRTRLTVLTHELFHVADFSTSEEEVIAKTKKMIDEGGLFEEKDLFIDVKGKSKAGDLLGQMPNEFRTPENLRKSAEEAIRKREIEQPKETKLEGNYISDKPKTFGQEMQRQQKELAFQLKYHPKSIKGDKLQQGVAIATTSALALITLPFTDTKQFFKGQYEFGKQIITNPSEAIQETVFSVKEDPIGFGTQTYLTGKAIGIVAKSSPIKLESATIGLEEQTVLGDIPSASFKGKALTIGGKPKFFAGYESGEIIPKKVYIGKEPPIIDLTKGGTVEKITQPISTTSQLTIFRKNLPQGLAFPEQAASFDIGLEAIRKVETKQPLYEEKIFRKETQTTTSKAVGETLNVESDNLNQIRKNFGSFAQEQQIKPTTPPERVPADIDILLKQKGASKFIPDIFPLNVLKSDIAETQAIEFVGKVQKSSSQELAFSKENPTLLEVAPTSSLKEQVGRHARDIHFENEDLGYILPHGKLYGLQAVQNPTKVEGLPIQRLSEQAIAKFGSISQFRKIKTPEELQVAKQIGLKKIKIGDYALLPESHRLKDIVDFNRILEKGFGEIELSKKVKSRYPERLFEEELPAMRGKSYRVKSSRVLSSRIAGSLETSHPYSIQSSYPPYSKSFIPSQSTSPSVSEISKPSKFPSQSQISKPSRSISQSAISDYSRTSNPSKSLVSVSTYSSSLSDSSSTTELMKSYKSFIDKGSDKKGFQDYDFGFSRKGRRKAGYTSSLVAEEFGITTKKGYKQLAGKTYSGLEVRPVASQLYAGKQTKKRRR